MFLLAPANPKELSDRLNWFKKPKARELAQAKGVEFGFELKGEPESIKETLPLFWGYHLPDYYLTQWYYHPEKQGELIDRLSHLNGLRPAYLNVHGAHVWWKPHPKNKIERYLVRSDSDTYLKILDSNIHFLKTLKALLPQTQITLENYPLYAYYIDKSGRFLPETYCYTGSGRLNDLLYLKEKTGVEILLDTEHLVLTINFLNRERNYKNVPIVKIPDAEMSEVTKTLRDIFGFYIKEDYYPYVEKAISYEEMVKKIGTKYYHLTGSTVDIEGNRIVTHAPIKKSDPKFREILRPVLAQKPKVLLQEVADSTVHECWNYLRPNEQEYSFEDLCEILLEEME